MNIHVLLHKFTNFCIRFANVSRCPLSEEEFPSLLSEFPLLRDAGRGRRHSIGYIYIGLNCTFESAVFNFSLPDIVMLTSAHLYRLYITHLYRKFFNITIRYYTMTKWFSYSKITPIFTYVISFLEIEMHLLKKNFFKFWFLLNY